MRVFNGSSFQYFFYEVEYAEFSNLVKDFFIPQQRLDRLIIAFNDVFENSKNKEKRASIIMCSTIHRRLW